MFGSPLTGAVTNAFAGQGDSEEWKQYWKMDLLLVSTLFPVI